MRILIINDACSKPYLVRYTLASLFGRELKLHVMLQSDNDREMHDHPWGFWSLVLSGGYREQVPSTQLDYNHPNYSGLITSCIDRKPGALDYRPPEWRHRVKLHACEELQPMPWPVKILQLWDLLTPFSRKDFKWWHAMGAIEHQIHRHERICCTLVLTTKRVREWGFWRDGQFIPHHQFKSEVEC